MREARARRRARRRAGVAGARARARARLPARRARHQRGQRRRARAVPAHGLLRALQEPDADGPRPVPRHRLQRSTGDLEAESLADPQPDGRATARAFSPWMRRCSAVSRPGGSGAPAPRSPSASQVGHVLAPGSPARARVAAARRGRERRVGRLDQRAQPRERREVGVERAAGREHRDLDRTTGNRRQPSTSPRAPTRPSRRRCGRRPGAARARARRSRSGPAPAGPGPGRATADARARRSAPRRTLAARAGRRRARPRGARRSSRRRRARPAGNARRPSRWSQSPCVASRPATANPACSTSAGSASSSAGSTGESITNASSPLRTTVQVVCQNWLVTTTTSAWTPTARIGRPRGP